MSKSIINNNKVCFVCKTNLNIHKHHIYAGNANRPKSEKYGCWIYLCAKHHNMSNQGIHFDKNLDLKVKKYCQRKFEKEYPNLDFIKIFGKNYI